MRRTQSTPDARRLLAMDLDGTLLRDDGEIAREDAAALTRAHDRGIAFTIATGRLASGVLLSEARALAIEPPLICADGGALACGRTGRLLGCSPLPEGIATRVHRVLSARHLHAFAMGYSVIHCGAAALAFASHVAGWSPSLVVHAETPMAATMHSDPIVAMLGVGPAQAVRSAGLDLQGAGAEALDVSTFPLDEGRDIWTVRVRPPSHGKGPALARLAARLRIPRENVAAVGDSTNDIDMLAWAGRSFCMAQAPPAVRAAASDVLEASCRTGGGIAEALARWLGSSARF